MPKIETFKIRTKNPNSPDGEWVEVLGVGFEYRGERFFYRHDYKNSTDVSHASSGLWVGFVGGRHSLKAAKELLDNLSRRHGWERLLSEIKARSKPI